MIILFKMRVALLFGFYISICSASAGSNYNFLESVCTQKLNLGSPCTPPKSPVKAYYFDSVNERCGHFQYVGCGGNENRFTNSDECNDSCRTPWFTKKNKEESHNSKGGDETAGRKKSDCQLKPDSGDCKALITMWYFDPDRRSCSVFAFGGCGGNLNRFDNRAECEDFCKSP